MTIRRILLLAGALACAAGGFLLAQRLDQMRYEHRAQAAQQGRDEEAAALRDAAAKWADAIAMTEGESLLRAFVAGIGPAVIAKRHETVELAAVSLLRIPGVAGVHVFGVDGDVLYSSDAKLTTTGKAGYRGAWALEASQRVSRTSDRPGLVDFAVPIENGGNRLAVVWLEYDLATVRDAARPAALAASASMAPEASPSGATPSPSTPTPPSSTAMPSPSIAPPPPTATPSPSSATPPSSPETTAAEPQEAQ